MRTRGRLSLLFVVVLLTSLEFGSGSVQGSPSQICAGGVAPTFRLAGKVQNREAFDIDVLRSMPATRHGEVLSDFGGDAQIFVAYQDGARQPLSADGMARLIVPGDARGGRYVSNIVDVSVGSA